MGDIKEWGKIGVKAYPGGLIPTEWKGPGAWRGTAWVLSAELWLVADIGDARDLQRGLTR